MIMMNGISISLEVIEEMSSQAYHLWDKVNQCDYDIYTIT